MRQLTLFSFCAPKGQKDVPAARPSASTCTDMGDADDDTSVVTALLEGANAACSTYETITVEGASASCSASETITVKGASDTCSTSASITVAVGKVDNHVSDSSLSQDPHESPIRMSPSSKRLQASRTCASEPPSANTCKRSKTLASTSAPRLKMCPTPPTAPSLCEYEKQRLENIRRNQEVLNSLSISNFSEAPPRPPNPNKRASATATQHRKRLTEFEVEPRRSGRSRNVSANVDEAEMGGKGEAAAAKSVPEPAELFYVDDDSVRKYASCTNAPPIQQWDEDTPRSVGIGRIHHSLANTDLGKKTYSVDFHHSRQLLATGGNQGWVSVFGWQGSLGSVHCDEDEQEVEHMPLFSFRAHQRWVSQVQFLAVNGGATLVLSAADDAALRVWNLDKRDTKDGTQPALVTQLFPHNSGIYSMHALEDRILTASKDASVVLSRLGQSALSIERTFDELHGAVVKCVRWRDGVTLASGGNERQIRVSDLRSSSEALSVPSGDVVNTLEWSPSDANVVACSGFARSIKIFDIRQTHQPLHLLDAHVSPELRQCKSIYQFRFFGSGKYIVTAGEKSRSLTVYNARSGATLSRGSVGCDPTAIAVDGANTQLVAAAVDRQVHFYRPVFVD